MSKHESHQTDFFTFQELQKKHPWVAPEWIVQAPKVYKYTMPAGLYLMAFGGPMIGPLAGMHYWPHKEHTQGFLQLFPNAEHWDLLSYWFPEIFAGEFEEFDYGVLPTTPSGQISFRGAVFSRWEIFHRV